MMKQDMFGCNNSTEINQIVLDHDHVNPSSIEGQEETSYLHYFPDPFLDDDDLFLSHFLSQQQQQKQDQLFSSGGDCCWDEEQKEEKKEEHGGDTSCEVKMKMKMKMNNKKKKKKCSSGSNRKNGSSGRKMRPTGKKDRHSKICTAQGPRDRRMRLSLQIARKFFDLQDMLGFDKASKTIEWLLSNSNSAIKDLKHSFLLNNNTSSSGFSYGSVYSGSSESVSEIIRDNNAVAVATKGEAAFMGTLKDKNSTRPTLRTVARESRDRARARARQRTILKKTEQQSTNASELQQNTHLQDCSSIHPKVFPISDHHHYLSDFPTIHTFFSGNNHNNTQFQNLDFPTLSCPNSIFVDSPFPKPYSFSDSTLLKLP